MVGETHTIQTEHNLEQALPAEPKTDPLKNVYKQAIIIRNPKRVDSLDYSDYRYVSSHNEQTPNCPPFCWAAWDGLIILFLGSYSMSKAHKKGAACPGLIREKLEGP